MYKGHAIHSYLSAKKCLPRPPPDVLRCEFGIIVFIHNCKVTIIALDQMQLGAKHVLEQAYEFIARLTLDDAGMQKHVL